MSDITHSINTTTLSHVFSFVNPSLLFKYICYCNSHYCVNYILNIHSIHKICNYIGLQCNITIRSCHQAIEIIISHKHTEACTRFIC